MIARRFRILSAMLSFAIPFCAVAVFVPSTASAAVLHVGGPGPGNYSYIQAAIDAASPGDVIFVHAGVYGLYFTVDKPVSLVGEDRNATILDGQYYDRPFVIKSDWVNMSGFTVVNASMYPSTPGLSVSSASHVVLEDLIVANNSIGIQFHGSSMGRISHSLVTGSRNGIILDSQSNFNEVSNNTISDNIEGVLLREGSMMNSVVLNTLSNCTSGIILESSATWSTSNNVAFANKVDNSSGAGILLRTSSALNRVLGNVVTNSGYGFFFYNTAAGIVENNTVSDSDCGICFLQSSSVIVRDNSLSANGEGIRIEETRSLSLDGNRLTNDGIVIFGDLLEFWTTHVIPPTNTVNGAPVMYLKNVNGLLIGPGAVGEVILANSVGVTVDSRIFVNSEVGVELGFSSGNAVTGNVFTNFNFGVLAYASRDNIIGNNTFYDGGNGTYLSYSTHNTISGNSYSVNWAGINLYSSVGNTFSDNSVTDNELGISLDYSSDDNSFLNNTVVSNAAYGFIITDSDNNRILGNEITNDGSGVSIDAKNCVIARNNITHNSVVGVDAGRDDGNLVYHNNFIDNFLQANSDGHNHFDNGYPSGGNYWGDYSGYDIYSGPYQNQLGSDGMGDIPYEIDDRYIGLEDHDQYPFIAPFGMPASLPTEPRNLRAQRGDGVVVLTWLAPLRDGGSPIMNYTLYRGNASGNETFMARLGRILTYTDTGLTNGVSYYYTVAATNDMGQGPNSTEVNATPGTAPSEPLNLQVAFMWNATAGNGSVLLTWEAPASDGGFLVMNYTIYRGKSPGDETLLAKIGNALTYTDTNIVKGQTYYYKVAAVNGVGEGPNSTEVSAVCTSPTTSKSILEEPWFWAVLLLLIVIAVAVIGLAMRRRRKGESAEKPSQSKKRSQEQ